MSRFSISLDDRLRMHAFFDKRFGVQQEFGRQQNYRRRSIANLKWGETAVIRPVLQ